jgi:glycosyltransferase involved in cell wall biosynthesis
MPYPLDAGAKVYSAQFARAIVAAGMELRFLGHGDHELARQQAPEIEWISMGRGRRPAALAFFSLFPHAAAVDATDEYSDLLDLQLREHWDAIVLDGYASGWALKRCQTYAQRAPLRPLLVHVSHNHEEAVWHSMAKEITGSPLKRIAAAQNYRKVRALERRLVHQSNLVTAITDEDGLALTNGTDAHFITVTPGYSGARTAHRHITADTPRRVILFGSFHWLAKQENLARFVECADPVFAQHGIELDVVGDAPVALIESLRARSQATRFHGFVNDPSSLLNQARMAVVPECIGGGFKLKVLDYLFARVPIASISSALRGLPQALKHCMLVRDDLTSLVAAIASRVDALDALNRMQDQAFTHACPLFDWRDRGVAFVAALARLRQPPARSH